MWSRILAARLRPLWVSRSSSLVNDFQSFLVSASSLDSMNSFTLFLTVAATCFTLVMAPLAIRRACRMREIALRRRVGELCLRRGCVDGHTEDELGASSVSISSLPAACWTNECNLLSLLWSLLRSKLGWRWCDIVHLIANGCRGRLLLLLWQKHLLFQRRLQLYILCLLTYVSLVHAAIELCRYLHQTLKLDRLMNRESS